MRRAACAVVLSHGVRHSLLLARGKRSSRLFPRAGYKKRRLAPTGRVIPAFAWRDPAAERHPGLTPGSVVRATRTGATSAGVGGRLLTPSSRPAAARDGGCPWSGQSGLRVAMRALDRSPRPACDGRKLGAGRPRPFWPTAIGRKLGGGRGNRVAHGRARDSRRLAEVDGRHSDRKAPRWLRPLRRSSGLARQGAILGSANECFSAGTLTGGFAPGAFAPAVGRRRSEPRGAPDRSRVLRVEAGSRQKALSSVARHDSTRISGAPEVVETSRVMVENASTFLGKAIEASGAP